MNTNPTFAVVWMAYLSRYAIGRLFFPASGESPRIRVLYWAEKSSTGVLRLFDTYSLKSADPDKYCNTWSILWESEHGHLRGCATLEDALDYITILSL